ncbi:hypothetical protein DFS34DRAFT_696377 [Phlyctochytrium arcticum]|nr:hypothetical protein DFS34DRAFT_696377 [Phlyctochytrium arcticum]
MPVATAPTTNPSQSGGESVSASSLNFNVADVVNQVFSLYTAPSGAAQKPTFARWYHPGAIFEDPLFRVYTPADREVQFASLPHAFSRIEVNRDQSTSSKPNYNIVSVTSQEFQRDGLPESVRHTPLVRIEIPNQQVYYLPKAVNYIPFAPSKVALDVLTKLTVERSTGRILKHQDIWTNTGEHWPGALPLIGGPAAWVYSIIKGPIGKGTSLTWRGLQKAGLLK